ESGRMISSLPSISVVIWIADTLSLTILSTILVCSRSSARYPYFSTLMHFTTISCYLLLMVGWLASFWTYFWLYFAFRLISDVLTALVAWEVYRKVFGPAMALPASTPRRIALKALAVMAVWVVLGLVLRATVGASSARKALTGEQMLY